MRDVIDLKISKDVIVTGKHPIVIIGPNGSGKTRLGARLSKDNDGDWIPALRNLALAENIPMQTKEMANDNLRSHKDQQKNQPWRLASEFDMLLAQMLAEDSESARKYRNECMIRLGNKPPETSVTKLVSFWNRVFPGRIIDMSSYKPTVTSSLSSSEVSYHVQQMSDGERAAMYLAARVISALPGLIIVDEPEVHFHCVLAKRFWNELELMRSDCRFVYITHDLPFAVSRQSAQFVILKSNGQPLVLPQQTNIPSDLIENILGAASFSVSTSRIVFCEGKVGSIDEALYDAWFQDGDTAVVPVGGWQNVLESVSVFNSSRLIVGANAIGIVDRDYWPDEYLKTLPSNIHVLQVHEAENLLCIRKVFLAVAKYLQINEQEREQKYVQFLEKAKAYFKNAIFNKQVLERVKKRCETNILITINNIHPESCFEDMKAKFSSGLNPTNWPFSADEAFEEEKKNIERVLEQGEDEILKVLPGKSYYSHAAAELGITCERFRNIVASALLMPDSSEQRTELGILKNELVEILKEHLPPRIKDPEHSSIDK